MQNVRESNYKFILLDAVLEKVKLNFFQFFRKMLRSYERLQLCTCQLQKLKCTASHDFSNT